MYNMPKHISREEPATNNSSERTLPIQFLLLHYSYSLIPEAVQPILQEPGEHTPFHFHLMSSIYSDTQVKPSSEYKKPQQDQCKKAHVLLRYLIIQNKESLLHNKEEAEIDYSFTNRFRKKQCKETTLYRHHFTLITYFLITLNFLSTYFTFPTTQSHHLLLRLLFLLSFLHLPLHNLKILFLPSRFRYLHSEDVLVILFGRIQLR